MARPKAKPRAPTVHYLPPTRPGTVTRVGWTPCGKTGARDDVRTTTDLTLVTCRGACLKAVGAELRYRRRGREFADREDHTEWTMLGSRDGYVRTPKESQQAFVPQLGWMSEQELRDFRRALGSALVTLTARREFDH